MDATSEARVAVLADPTTRFLGHQYNGDKKPGKKRVRRVQRELSFLRQQVNDLELQLELVKLQQTPLHSSGRQLSAVRVAGMFNLDSAMQDQDVVWSDIAERQLKERLRAEKQQQELKESLTGMTQLHAELCRLVKRCGDTQQEVLEHLAHTPKQRYRDFPSDAVEETFAEQLAVLARLEWELQPSPYRALYPSPELTLGKAEVKWDRSADAGFTVANRSQNVLPFTLDVAAQAYWRLLGCGETSRVCSLADLQADVVARSFSLRTDFEGFTAENRGTFSCRKQVNEDTVTIAWVGNGDVLELGGAKFDGVQVHKRGIIKLRRVSHEGPGNASLSTIVETSFETVPVFHEGLANRDSVVHTLFSIISKSYGKVNGSFGQKMSRLLLEEDWKATFA